MFEDVDPNACESINPIVSFQAEELSNGRFDPVDNTPGFPDHQQINQTNKLFSDQFGRQITFNATDDMIFES